MAPALHRFAQAGWDWRDVELAVRDVLAARVWKVPPNLKQPAAYLADLLREVDPADRPGALEEWMAKEKRATERRWHAALKTTCAHGVPAGDVPNPLGSHLACPACRAASH